MRAFLSAVVITAVIGAGAAFTLSKLQEPSAVAYSTQGVRL